MASPRERATPPPDRRRPYQRPEVLSERFKERSALACAKMPLQTRGCTNNPGVS